MAASDNINRNQIPGHHIDAIRAAIEHHGSQGITFSPTSTDFTDESGKTHRVPVGKDARRYLLVNSAYPKASAYSHTLPSESTDKYLNTFNGHSHFSSFVSMDGPVGTANWEPDLASKMRASQLAAADGADEEATREHNQSMGMYGDYIEKSRKYIGNRSHLISVTVENDKDPDASHYEYDTKTGNIGPFIEPDYDAWESTAMEPTSVKRSRNSGLGLPGKHLRSFDR